MRPILVGTLVCLVLFGVGCAASDPSAKNVQPAGTAERIAPLPSSPPTAAPEIPEAAKNVPRPQ